MTDVQGGHIQPTIKTTSHYILMSDLIVKKKADL